MSPKSIIGLTEHLKSLYKKVAEVRLQLIKQKNYKDEELPSAETIRRRLNELGYTLKRVVKAKPIKEIPETAAIFEQVGAMNEQADKDPNLLRISMDAKVAIKVGENLQLAYYPPYHSKYHPMSSWRLIC